MKSRLNMNGRPQFEAGIHSAFTRVELLVLLAVITLLAAVILPAVANSRPRSHRVICANNLRQIGVAMHVWGHDHGDQPPHHLLVEQGGTKRHPLAANTWLHFSWISNELSSPKLLFCPSDTGSPASDFTGNPAGGYVHPKFANNATSYFLTFTFSGDNHRIQVGDRNIRTFGVTGSSYFNTALYVHVMPIDPAFGWTAGLHEYAGNLLFTDGQVELASSQRLREAAERGNDFFGSAGSRMRFCVPR
jgi:competence protein ComGC